MPAKLGGNLPGKMSGCRCVLVALAVAFQGASSQAVEGRVVGAATGQPIPGALVLLLDSGRVERARAASAVGGTFRLAASAPGEYRFVVLRIGFARWESPPLRLEAGRTLQYVVELPEEPLQLGGITVERESGCRVRPAAGETAGVLWEEARKALALAEVTKRERRYLFHMVKTERRLGVTLQPLEDA
ncbi:MAG TPA: carboxypeptidase-like regulatory domain-containing protein, partial [Methylomirabilota bacterium]|nr:carboxypeptidase-like regulatory domain-containing protein [Methylomirabilota bacterium]